MSARGPGGQAGKQAGQGFRATGLGNAGYAATPHVGQIVRVYGRVFVEGHLGSTVSSMGVELGRNRDAAGSRCWRGAIRCQGRSTRALIGFPARAVIRRRNPDPCRQSQRPQSVQWWTEPFARRRHFLRSCCGGGSLTGRAFVLFLDLTGVLIGWSPQLQGDEHCLHSAAPVLITLTPRGTNVVAGWQTRSISSRYKTERFTWITPCGLHFTFEMETGRGVPILVDDGQDCCLGTSAVSVSHDTVVNL